MQKKKTTSKVLPKKKTTQKKVMKKSPAKGFDLEGTSLIRCYPNGYQGYNMQIQNQDKEVIRSVIGKPDNFKFTIMFPKKTKLPYETYYAKNCSEAIRQWIDKHHMKNKTKL